MTFAQLFSLIRKADLSPEQFASYLGISGMTIRRWQAQDPQAVVPELYQMALVKTVEKLVMDGFLDVHDEEVKPFLKDHHSENLRLNLQTLGLDLDELKKLENPSGQNLEETLRKIGASEKRQEQVLGHLDYIRKLTGLHESMKESVKTLLGVIGKKNIAVSAKMVAFGALFYLIAPLDLIPDSVPVFGFVDDVAILNLAAMYYAAGMAKILSGGEKSSGADKKNKAD